MGTNNGYTLHVGGTSLSQDVAPVTQGTPISADTFKQMIAIIENLAYHQHSVPDEYGTACNCNCACNCTRGSI